MMNWFNKGCGWSFQDWVITMKSIKSFNTVVGLRRDYASAWYERARINIRIGNTQDSLYDLRQAIRIGKEPYRMKAIEEKEFESLVY